MTPLPGGRLALVVAACLVPVLGLAAPVPRAVETKRPDGKRTAITRMAIGLDQTLRQICRPSPLNLFGPAQTTRGYRIPGVGVVFIVPARTLPAPQTARRHVDRAARPVSAASFLDPVPPSIGTQRAGPRPAEQATDEGMRALREAEEQARLMNETALRMHIEFEQLFADVVKGAPPVAGEVAPHPPPALPPLPPWFEWSSETSTDTRTPGDVLDDVREALGRILVAAEPLDLRADESFVVTVDFFDDVALDLSAHPTATLIARIKAGDLEPGRRNPYTRAEIEKRVEFTEFE